MSLIRWSELDGRVGLDLPGDLDLPMAQPLVDSLRAAFKASGDVTVRADSVERVSAACIQALVVASRDAAERGAAFALAAPSQTLLDACEDLGLAAWLNRWSRA
ncbi:STAS domain-containing protein [Azospirillum picis]|uniref:Anti-anti-sigma regulatory factor n=1 Tax=Azospirillum picis TaxID=488438 RepID=A0ABU0MKL2_9PROT|nr:STAS domain-containing protein [Azospirillum picis]MBP2300148.1 anti-anti-sigma regulatory factor [Azospirillum picis]MDQ0534010.1 anti-anti-sigma regulatory factor [Azospirillum picis]